MYWNLDNTARSEWANLVKSKSKQSRLNWLGMLSITNGGIPAFRQRSPGSCGSSGRAIPLAYNDLSNATPVVRRSRKAMRWRLPVRRVPGTESEITGRASGLMQIMPGTATHTVKMFSIPVIAAPAIAGSGNKHQHWHQLPAICLSAVWHNRIFSSAAYNAGPWRVRTAWQQRRAYRRSGICRVFHSPRRAVM